MNVQENSQTYTVIICDGMSNAQINPAARFVNAKESIGRREIERLMGIGRHYGDGPLPIFLHAATEARSNGVPIGIVMLQTTLPAEAPIEKLNPADGEAFDFPTQLEDIQSKAQVIKTDVYIIPWQQLYDALESLTGRRLLLDDAGNDKIRFLIVGSHTEGRPSAIAMHLKSAFGLSLIHI